ncbi:uroporphyrinogen-III synthase, partial [Acinetobacter sp. 11520]|nr:uroporphyrinogen-III synthase [Acinetobacter sp. 11520]
RPDSRAAELTEALQNEGYQVESLPLLELVAKPFSEHLLQLYQQLIRAQAIVVVSPTAVEVGVEYLVKSGLKISDLKHIQWIAVGQATANCLNEYGIQAHIPDVETSEGMLNLPILHNMQQTGSVAFWRGEGGRQFMMETLQQQGIQILNFVLYHRQ